MFRKVIALVIVGVFCLMLQVSVNAETLRTDNDSSVAFSEYYDYIKLYPDKPDAFDKLVELGKAYRIESGTKCIILERCVYDSFYTKIIITSGPLRGKEGYVCNSHIFR